MGSSTFSVSSCLREVRGLASIPFPLTPTLPKERENYRQSLPHRRRFDLGTESAAPSPWGEGWGEGDRSARLPMAYPLEPSRNDNVFDVLGLCSKVAA